MSRTGGPERQITSRAEQRIRAAVATRLEPTEEVVAWTRAWVSVPGRFHRLTAARTRDFLVVTDRRLMLWSTGFFTRRPRRRVLTERLAELTFDPPDPAQARRFTCHRSGRRPLLVELGRSRRDREATEALTPAATDRGAASGAEPPAPLVAATER